MSWDTALDRFGLDKISGSVSTLNHKVLKVEEGQCEDVYDLISVVPNSNFALDSGVFVHNSKDDIFGVDGWGAVTANKYVRQYGDLESVIAGVQAIEKKSKKEQTLINSIPRVRLAKSLKKMDLVPDLPRPRMTRFTDVEQINTLFLELGFASLLKEAWRLV